jgi:hypothetical protein
MWSFLKQVLEFPWWQGIAGVAQIIAAVFALVTIRQARRMILIAEAERKATAAERLKATMPNWEVEGVINLDEQIIVVRLQNVGPGTALFPILADFKPERKNPVLTSFETPGAAGPRQTVRPGEVLNIRLDPNAPGATNLPGHPCEGDLVVTSGTLYTDRTKTCFRVMPSGGGLYRCVQTSPRLD